MTLLTIVTSALEFTNKHMTPTPERTAHYEEIVRKIKADEPLTNSEQWTVYRALEMNIDFDASDVAHRDI